MEFGRTKLYLQGPRRFVNDLAGIAVEPETKAEIDLYYEIIKHHLSFLVPCLVVLIDRPDCLLFLTLLQ